MVLDILSCPFDKSTLRSQQTPSIDPVEIQSCSKKYLCDVIFSGPVASKLFPNNAILVNWFPIEPLPSNIDYLMQENGDLIYFAVEKCTDYISPRSVSFGVLSQTVMCMKWSAAICTSDEVLYQAHLVHQFKRACEVIKDADFRFSCFQDQVFTNRGRRFLQERLRTKLFDK